MALHIYLILLGRRLLGVSFLSDTLEGAVYSCEDDKFSRFCSVLLPEILQCNGRVYRHLSNYKESCTPLLYLSCPRNVVMKYALVEQDDLVLRSSLRVKVTVRHLFFSQKLAASIESKTCASF